MNFLKIPTKSLKIILITIIVLISFVLLPTVIMSKEEKFFHQKLEEFVASNKDFISLKELTNFEWDKVCYSSPYIGFEDRDFKEFKMNKSLPDVNDDSKSAIIFLNKKTTSGKVFIIYRGKSEAGLIENIFEKEVCQTNENSTIVRLTK